MASKFLGISENDRRILLIGKTGVGKSTTGNAILGQPSFYAKVSSNSVTQETQHHTVKHNKKNILVVDTPGIFTVNKTNDDVMLEIAKCFTVTSPGLHSIVLVVKADRLTQEDTQTIELFLKHFGKEVEKHMIVAFTHKNNLTTHGQTIEQYVETIDKKSFMFKLLESINFRYVAFGYKGIPAERENEVKNLLDKIEAIIIQNRGSCYTIQTYKEIEKNITEERKKEQKKKEEERKAEMDQALKPTKEAHDKEMQELKAKKDADIVKYTDIIEQTKSKKKASEREVKEAQSKLIAAQNDFGRQIEQKNIIFSNRIKNLNDQNKINQENQQAEYREKIRQAANPGLLNAISQSFKENKGKVLTVVGIATFIVIKELAKKI